MTGERFIYSIRDVMWFTAICATLLAWFVDRRAYTNVVVVVDPVRLANSVPATSNARIVHISRGEYRVEPVDKVYLP
jgi:hypothetical protein